MSTEKNNTDNSASLEDVVEIIDCTGMSYQELISTIVSGCKFKYFSYDHKKAMVEYNTNDEYAGARKVFPKLNSWDVPLELKEKYKIDRIGTLREVEFSTTGRANLFKIGKNYSKHFTLKDFGVTVFPLKMPVPIESTTGYSCPNCGAMCSEHTLISKTDPEFDYVPDPHYSWDETHKCKVCGTLYLLHNGN